MSVRFWQNTRFSRRPSRVALLFSLLGLLLLAVLLGTVCSGLSVTFSPLGIHFSNGAQSSGEQASSPTPRLTCQDAARATNPIIIENTCPGTGSWQLDGPTGPSNAIEAFTAPASVNAGESIQLYVSTTAHSYTFRIYRMGWYQGLGGRLVYSSTQLTGILQPPPLIDPATRMVSCSNWHNPVTLSIPKSWVSGVYIVKLVSLSGYERYTLFTVRDDASHSALLFQTSILTYQAYNSWGGYSLYRGGITSSEATAADRAYVVSFDRPYADHAGLMDFVRYELNFLRWLERDGYDVSYTTDIDTDMHGDLLLHHRLFLSVGHDEYWSTAMRQNVTAARDAGISLAFFGANDIYWHVRLQSSPLGKDREEVCYKPGYYPDRVTDPLSSTDPQESTVLWRDPPLNNPENAVLGEMYGGAASNLGPLVLDSGAAPFFTGTSLRAGSAVKGLIAEEYDRVYQNGVTPSNLTILASSPLKCIATSLCPASGMDTTNATLYTASSGARVFDAGTWMWSWGLDDEHFDSTISAHHLSTADFQTLTKNLLAYLLT